MTFPWPNTGMSVVFIEDGDIEVFAGAAEVIDKALAPKPEVPPEVWNETKPDPERCMAAVRAMCG